MEQLPLLRRQFGHVIIPRAVPEECRINENLPGTDAISKAIEDGWLSVKNIAKQADAVLLERDLDKGEAEAIATRKNLKKADKKDIELILNGADAQAKQLDIIRTEQIALVRSVDRLEKKVEVLETKETGCQTFAPRFREYSSHALYLSANLKTAKRIVLLVWSLLFNPDVNF